MGIKPKPGNEGAGGVAAESAPAGTVEKITRIMSPPGRILCIGWESSRIDWNGPVPFANQQPNNLMKPNLSKITMAASVAVSMFFVSCGDDKKGGGGADTLDSLADEVIEQVNRVPEAMSSIKDKESAETAAKTIGDVGDQLVSIAGRMEKLDVPSDEEKKRIDKKIEDGIAGGDEKMGSMDPKVMADPEIQKIIGDAMKGFMEKMKKAEETFKKYGKDSNKGSE